MFSKLDYGFLQYTTSVNIKGTLNVEKHCANWI